MIELPSKAYEIRRWKPEPGDVLIVRNTECEIDREQAAEIKREVRRVLQLPDDVEIMALGRDWEVTAGKLPR